MRRELVASASGGSHDAFAELVEGSIDRLYAVATLILRDRALAEDAVQEALVAAWRDLRALRDPDAWDAWLYRLTVRACYRQANKVRRRATVEFIAVTDPEAGPTTNDTNVIVERDRLERHLGKLPIDQRAVIVLHYFVGRPLTEVASVLDIPVGTAKSRLHRGLESLRVAMQGEPEARSRRAEERTA
jgi:RNA polymerase sigma-70 factor (ECF subfamily)